MRLCVTIRAMTLLDRDIREPLFDYLEQEYGTIRIIEEKTMGKSRADAFMVSRQGLFGIEIKSDADSYARLERQVRDYDRYFDYNYLVVGTSHITHAAEHIPEWWGLINAELENGSVDLYTVRKPCRNPKVKLRNKLSILWRPELAKVQANCHLPKYTAKSKRFVQDKLLEKVREEELEQEIIQALFERDYTLIEAEISAFRGE